MSSQNSNPGNFANRPKEEVKNIVSKGGRATGRNFVQDWRRKSEAGRKGGLYSSGNFVHRSERAKEAGSNLEQETD